MYIVCTCTRDESWWTAWSSERWSWPCPPPCGRGAASSCWGTRSSPPCSIQAGRQANTNSEISTSYVLKTKSDEGVPECAHGVGLHVVLAPHVLLHQLQQALQVSYAVLTFCKILFTSKILLSFSGGIQWTSNKNHLSFSPSVLAENWLFLRKFSFTQAGTVYYRYTDKKENQHNLDLVAPHNNYIYMYVCNYPKRQPGTNKRYIWHDKKYQAKIKRCGNLQNISEV
jgi:hypothetical protein